MARSQPQSRFDEVKTTEAAARFLDLAGGRMNYMLLIKLLYLLDRTALRKHGRPVTGDDYFSMKLGPVLSRVLDLVAEMPDPDHPGFWSRHISSPSRYNVKLRKRPGRGHLSDAEIGYIERIFEKYGHYDPFDLADHLHNTLKEWTPVEAGREPLPIADILHALHKKPAQIKAIERELDSVAAVKRLFSPSSA